MATLLTAVARLLRLLQLAGCGDVMRTGFENIDCCGFNSSSATPEHSHVLNLTPRTYYLRHIHTYLSKQLPLLND